MAEPTDPKEASKAKKAPSWLLFLLIAGVLTAVAFSIRLGTVGHPMPSATGVLCIVVLFTAAAGIIVLHLVAANLDPVYKFVSEYSDVRGYGVIMRAAFFLIAIATLNLAIAILQFKEKADFPAGLMYWLTFGAGVLTVGMGIFSQRTTTPGEIHTSRFVGTVHGFCAGTSFGLAILTMVVFACQPPHGVDEWIRGAALAHFNIATVVAVIYYILGLGKVKEVRKVKPKLSVMGVLAADAAATNILSKTDPTDDHPLATDTSKPEDIDTLNRGLGLVERILIFMFIEWELVLSWVVHSHHTLKLH